MSISDDGAETMSRRRVHTFIISETLIFPLEQECPEVDIWDWYTGKLGFERHVVSWSLRLPVLGRIKE